LADVRFAAKGRHSVAAQCSGADWLTALFCPIAPFCSAVAAYGAGRLLRENLREDENNGRDKAAMQATSLALMIPPASGWSLSGHEMLSTQNVTRTSSAIKIANKLMDASRLYEISCRPRKK
jgi:hypothetical protein